MTRDDAGDHGAPPVHIDVDVAERLVKASALHAQGALTDGEFVELRERLLTADDDRGSNTGGVG